MKRLAIYVAVTFGLTWGLLIPAGFLLGTFANGEASSPVMMGLIALSMFFPLIGARGVSGTYLYFFREFSRDIFTFFE